MATKTPKTNEVRQEARKVYLSGDYTLEEVARLTGKTRQTIGRWAKEDQWADLKAANSITPELMIKQWQQQIVEINEAISARPPGQRRATPEEADVMSKLRKNIKEMQVDLGIPEVISTLMRFLTWLRPLDPESAIKFNGYMDAFVKDQVASARKR